jgi:kynureninase
LDLFTADFADSMDAQDELATFRNEFTFPKGPNHDRMVYFCGNSLGLQPKGLRKLITNQLDKWDEQAVEGHFTGTTRLPW